VPSSFLCTLMSLQTSFLVFSSFLQTRLVSAAFATVIKLTAMTVAQQIFIIPFMISSFRFQGVVVVPVRQMQVLVWAWQLVRQMLE